MQRRNQGRSYGLADLSRSFARALTEALADRFSTGDERLRPAFIRLRVGLVEGNDVENGSASPSQHAPRPRFRPAPTLTDAVLTAELKWRIERPDEIAVRWVRADG